MARPRVTLRDVARQVGVHPSTVSRALNPDTRKLVTEDVAKRVEEAVEALGYRPNSIAYSLKTNRTLTVGVMIPDLTNPVFPPIIRGIEDRLAAAGYTAIFANSDNDPARERVILDRMRGRRVDGLIMATAHHNDPLVVECIDDDIPLVLINRKSADPRATSVVTDDGVGLRLTVAHIAGLGHRRIAHVAGPQDLSTGHDRYRGFLEAMALHGFAADPALIHVCSAFTIEEGRRALTGLLDAGLRFTAVVAANDLLALGCYDALEAHGLVCPDDVSVTGFNDMPFVDKLTPPLTTVRIPHYRMGEEAATALLDLMRAPGGGHTVVLTPELVIRGSTAPPKDAR